ncbi:MAG: hypothetical protein ACRDVM_07385 [Acidimicrobiia bacterium]
MEAGRGRGGRGCRGDGASPGRRQEHVAHVPTRALSTVYRVELVDQTVSFKADGQGAGRIATDAWVCERVRHGVPAPPGSPST